MFSSGRDYGRAFAAVAELARLAEASDKALPMVEAHAIGPGSPETVSSIRSLTRLRAFGASPDWGEGKRIASNLSLPM